MNIVINIKDFFLKFLSNIKSKAPKINFDTFEYNKYKKKIIINFHFSLIIVFISIVLKDFIHDMIFISEKESFLISFYPTINDPISFYGFYFTMYLVLVIYVYHLIKSNAHNFHIIEIPLILVYYINYKWDKNYIFADFIPGINFEWVDTIILITVIIKLINLIRNLIIKERNSVDYIIDPDLDFRKSKTYKDYLNRSRMAEDIANVIYKLKPNYSIGIGICSAWGIGKSSFIAMIIDELEKLNIKEKNKIKIIYFNPWYYSNEEGLTKGFLDTLSSEFYDQGYWLSKEINRYSELITNVNNDNLLVKLAYLTVTSTKSIEDKKSEISNILEKSKNKYLIVIDDLDRLNKDEIITLLKLIRLIGDFPNIIYLVAYDKDYINSAIKDRLTSHNSDKYLEKIFQLEFELPIPEKIGIVEILYDLLVDKTNIINKDINISISKKEILLCCQYNFVTDVIINIRDAKKFSNSLIFKLILIKNEICFIHLFLLELVSFLFPSLYKAIYLSRDNFLDYVSIGYDKEKKITDFIGNIGHNSSGIRSTSINIILSMISHHESNPKYSFFNKLYFYRYYSLSFFRNDITEISVLESLKENKDATIKLLNLYGTNSKKFNEILERQLLSDSNLNKISLENIILFSVEILSQKSSDDYIQKHFNNSLYILMKNHNLSINNLNSITLDNSIKKVSFCTLVMKSIPEIILNNINIGESSWVIVAYQLTLDIMIQIYDNFLIDNIIVEDIIIENRSINNNIFDIMILIGDYSTFLPNNWLMDNYFKKFKSIHNSILQDVINYAIQKSTTKTNTDELKYETSNILKKIYISPEHAKQFIVGNSEKHELELFNYCDWYYPIINDLNLFKKHPDANVGENDVYYMNNENVVLFDLENYNYELKLFYPEERFWRFGLKFVKNDQQMNNDIRHLDDQPIIQFSEGGLSKERDIVNENFNVVFRRANEALHKTNISTPFELLIFEICHNKHGVELKVSDSGVGSMFFKELINFKLFGILAWADYNEFNIKISLGRKKKN